MKLRILSDLHNEFGQLSVPDCDADAVILAGDIDRGVQGAVWALQTFHNKPIIYVTGNHEYYGLKMSEVDQQLSDLAVASNLVFLKNSSVVLNNIRFLGCTLWSNFFFQDKQRSEFSSGSMNDYKHILTGPAPGSRRMQPEDCAAMHAVSLRFLKDELKKDHFGKTVVITHHLPSSRSLYRDGHTETEIAEDCTEIDKMILTYKPAMWIHGHRHLVQDYFIGDTRILCNPRGYEGIKKEEQFNPEFLIELTD